MGKYEPYSGAGEKAFAGMERPDNSWPEDRSGADSALLGGGSGYAGGHEPQSPPRSAQYGYGGPGFR